MGILSTAAGGIPADSHLVGDQRAETVHARTTAGSIDCRIRKRAQAWTGERLEQEIGLCRKLSNGIDDHFAKSAAWLRRTAGRARSLNVASKAAPTSFSKSLRPTYSLTCRSSPCDGFAIRLRETPAWLFKNWRQRRRCMRTCSGQKPQRGGIFVGTQSNGPDSAR